MYVFLIIWWTLRFIMASFGGGPEPQVENIIYLFLIYSFLINYLLET